MSENACTKAGGASCGVLELPQDTPHPNRPGPSCISTYCEISVLGACGNILLASSELDEILVPLITVLKAGTFSVEEGTMGFSEHGLD